MIMSQLENECIQTDPSGKGLGYQQEDRGSVWVEMEYYKSIAPARGNSKRSMGQSSSSYRVAWAELHRTTSS